MGVSLKDCYTDKDGVLRTRKDGCWIPCKDMMPEVEGYYLVTLRIESRYAVTVAELCETPVDVTSTKFAWYVSSDWDYYSDDYEVIAWMELPEAYKEAKS